MSRIMLAVKAIMSKYTKLPAIVFDEPPVIYIPSLGPLLRTNPRIVLLAEFIVNISVLAGRFVPSISITNTAFVFGWSIVFLTAFGSV